MGLANRLASVLLGCALVAGGIWLAVETVLVALDQPAWLVPRNRWYAELTSAEFADRPVQIGFAAAAAAGLLILAAQLWPRRPYQLPIGDGWLVHRRSVERRLAVVADEVPGVNGARVGVGRGWRVRVHAIGDDSDRAELDQAVTGELDRIGAPPARRVRLRLNRRRRVL